MARKKKTQVEENFVAEEIMEQGLQEIEVTEIEAAIESGENLTLVEEPEESVENKEIEEIEETENIEEKVKKLKNSKRTLPEVKPKQMQGNKSGLRSTQGLFLR